MTALVIMLIVAAVVVLGVVLFALGQRAGGGHWKSELARVRMQAVQAERQIHGLTRDAFVAMAEEAQRRRGRAN